MGAFEPITADLLEKLKAERERTGVTPSALLRHCGSPPPDGLSLHMPGAWLRGTTKAANPKHVVWVLEAYASLPSTRPVVRISDAICEHLKAEIARTGVRPGKALGQGAKDRPFDLNSTKVLGWLKAARPSVPKAHVDYLFDRYATFPDRSAPYVPITDAYRNELMRHRERTGISFGSLLRMADKTTPPGLTINTVNGWIPGRAKTGRADQLDWVITHYETLPACDMRAPFTEEMRDRLGNWRDLGLIPAFYFSNAADIPHDLTSSMLGNWLTKNTKSVTRAHYDHVAAFCEAALSDPDTKVRFNSAMRLLLREVIRKRQGRSDDPARTLAIETVRGWLALSVLDIHPKQLQKLLSALSQ